MSKHEKFFLTLLVAVPCALVFDMLTAFHPGINVGVGIAIGLTSGWIINRLFK